jgi:hypothetical protein
MVEGKRADTKHNRGRGESGMDARGRVGDAILVFDGVHRYDTGLIVKVYKTRCYFRSDKQGCVIWCTLRFVKYWVGPVYMCERRKVIKKI